MNASRRIIGLWCRIIMAQSKEWLLGATAVQVILFVLLNHVRQGWSCQRIPTRIEFPIQPPVFDPSRSIGQQPIRDRKWAVSIGYERVERCCGDKVYHVMRERAANP